MGDKAGTIHPYIPNSVPAIKREMLRATGASSIEDFYADIPLALRLKRPLNLPPALRSEHRLRQHVDAILARNVHCAATLSFLGGGCYQHHVPSVCDEINSRSEFVTAYAGEPYDDAGRFQALFEYASMMGELLEMDVVNVPTYDGYQAAATAVRMAGRYTQRRTVLVSAAVAPEKITTMTTYGRSDLDFRLIAFDPKTGGLNREALRADLSASIACLYLENPSYFGTIDEASDIASMVHECGALFVVGTDPNSLGGLVPPVRYGADIVCGDIQSLGMHMAYGSGQAGFIATQDNERLVREFPSRLFGIAPTQVPGEYGFGDVAYSRTSFDKREEGNEYVGTMAALWGITAGVYLALMGPQGMAELASGILQRTAYAKKRLAEIPGITIPHIGVPNYRDFLVRFDRPGKTVREINADLRAVGIFGGVDLSQTFPAFGLSALFCVTEVHSKEDIDRLVSELSTILK